MGMALLAVMVVVGIALIVLVVHLTGGSIPARLADGEQARTRLLEDYPEVAIREVHLTQQANTAFLGTSDGRIGIVHGLGGKFLTRLLSAPDIGKVTRKDPRTLTIRLNDFTWPGGNFRFEDEGEAMRVEMLFNALRRNGRWEERAA